MYEIRDLETDRIVKAGIKTQVHVIAALTRMAPKRDAFACSKGGKVLVAYITDAGRVSTDFID